MYSFDKLETWILKSKIHFGILRFRIIMLILHVQIILKFIIEQNILIEWYATFTLNINVFTYKFMYINI